MDTVIGFFGQSGAGKTTIIKNFPNVIGKKYILRDTNIIRSLFQRNPNKYTNPNEILSCHTDNNEIQHLYERYIRSQFQLLNDFSTELFELIRDKDKRNFDSIILCDRTPVDFFVLTVCGLNFLKSNFNKDLNSFNTHLLSLLKNTAEHNANFLLDLIVVTHPWNNVSDKLLDGVRDQYLTDFYTGDSWYGKFGDIVKNRTKVYTIDSDVKTLDDRVNHIINSGLIE